MSPLSRTLVAVCATVGLLPTGAAAQTPGTARFSVFQRGEAVGRMTVTVERTADGWDIRSDSEIGGDFQLSVRRFEASYSPSWQARSMTMELATPDEHAVVHVAMLGSTTRTDIVRPGKEALFGANDVAADTLFLPDYVFGAFEALAARLEDPLAGRDVPFFLVPRIEVRALVDRRPPSTVRTEGGTSTATRWHITVKRDLPTPVELWAAGGRLLRLDLPAEDISVVRSDILGPASTEK